MVGNLVFILFIADVSDWYRMYWLNPLGEVVDTQKLRPSALSMIFKPLEYIQLQLWL